MSGKGARLKGHNWEREVAARLRAAMPGCDVKRGFQYRGGAEASDVENPFFHVECKVGKKQNPRAALAQAVSDAAYGKVPVAIVKDDQEKPGVPANAFAVMRFSEFLELVNEWYERGNR